jgi:SM-20-related protein
MNKIFESIADGIAEQGFSITDNFLSSAEIKQILDLPEYRDEELSTFKQAGIGKSSDKVIVEVIRGDYIKWIDKKTAAPPVATYLEKLDSLISFINQSLFLSLKDYEVHLTQYPVGTYYKRHLDQFKKDDHRKLSVILYLNQNWLPEHGGSLRMYLEHDRLETLPIAGRLVCFRSDVIEHEVLPATRERRSITGWLLDQPIDIPFL